MGLVHVAKIVSREPTRFAKSAPDVQWWAFGRSRFLVNQTDKWRVTCRARRDGLANGTFYMGVALYDAAGANITGDGTFWFYAANAVTPTFLAAGSYSGVFGAGTAKTVPAGAVWGAPVFGLNVGGTSRSMYCSAPVVALDAYPDEPVSADPWLEDPSEWLLHAGTQGAVFFASVAGSLWSDDLRTRYYATRPYTRREPASLPRDVEPRLVDPGLVRSAMPTRGYGACTGSYGDLTLANADGALSLLALSGLDGQRVTVYRGDDSQTLSQMTRVIDTVAEQAVFDEKVMRVILRGPEWRFDRPLQTRRYLGDDSPLEGGAALRGRVKPVVFGAGSGYALHWEPPCVDVARAIFQLMDGAPWPANNLVSVYVDGAVQSLTAGATYSDEADVLANAPTAGQYRVWTDATRGVYVRLESLPAGRVTMSTYGGAGLGNVALAAGLTAAVGYQHNNVADTIIWSGAVDPAVGNNAPAFLRACTTDITMRELLDEALYDLGAAGGCGFLQRLGVHTDNWFGKPWPAPIPEPWPPTDPDPNAELHYDGTHILAVKPITDPGPRRGIPATGVDVRYYPNDAVLSAADIGGSAYLNSWTTQDYLEQQSHTPGYVSLRHETAQREQRGSHIVASPAGMYEHVQRLALIASHARCWFDVTLPAGEVLARSESFRPALGGHVYLSWPGYRTVDDNGVYATSAWFVVMAVEVDAQRDVVRLTVMEAPRFSERP